MHLRYLQIFFACLFSLSSPISQAGSFWFPISGHYPYSSNLKVNAVPDLNQSSNSIKTRLWQTGVSDGQTITSSGLSAFVKSSGGDWDFDGVPYNDTQGGSGKKYLWFDNHTGYDFSSTDSGSHGIYSVESGTTCGYVSTYGQLCIEHSIGSSTYRTWYTHMSNIPAALKTNSGLGHYVYRWYFLGYMSNVGASAVHLHFVTRKLVGSEWQVVDPYGHKSGWPSNTSDDSANPYLWN